MIESNQSRKELAIQREQNMLGKMGTVMCVYLYILYLERIARIMTSRGGDLWISTTGFTMTRAGTSGSSRNYATSQLLPRN